MADGAGGTVELRLYVSAPSAYSHNAIRTISELRERLALPDAAVEVIDVFERPELAAADRVLATPTLVRLRPAPRTKLVGEFELTEVMSWLGVGEMGGS